MKRAATGALALGAVVVVSIARPASAEIVIGGSNQPAVEVNWSVIDRLGPPPTLADMLKADIPLTTMRQQMAPAGKPAQPIAFRPYKPEPKKAARKPAVQPAVAKAEPVRTVTAEPVPKAAPAVAKAQPVPAVTTEPAVRITELATKAEPVPAKVPAPVAPVPAKAEKAPALPPKPALPEPVVAKAPEPAPLPGLKVTLPSTPVPAPEPAKPAEVAKVEPPPAPVAVPAPAAAPVPAPQQVAALPPAPPPAAPSAVGDNLTIPFAADNARLPDTARSDLQKLAARMEKEEALSLQLLAYAGGDEASASKARRLSLSRALEVRKFLMDQGVRSTRIEVRALGAKSDGGPSDRVDAVVVSR